MNKNPKTIYMQTSEQFYKDRDQSFCCSNQECEKRYQAAVDAYKYIKMQLIHSQNKLKAALDRIDELTMTVKADN